MKDRQNKAYQEQILKKLETKREAEAKRQQEV